MTDISAKIRLYKWVCVFLWQMLVLLDPKIGFGYTDEIVLKAPKQILTTYDVKVFALLRNLLDNQTWLDVEDKAWQKEFLKEESQGLLEHWVVSKYLKQSRSKSVSSGSQARRRIKQTMLGVFKTAAEKNKRFKIWHIDENTLNQWISQRAALEAFLQSYPPFQAIVTDQRLKTHYETHKANRFLNKAFDSIKALVEKDFQKQHLKSTFGKWMTSEMRRQRWKVHEP